jgi:hypothetical protein
MLSRCDNDDKSTGPLKAEVIPDLHFEAKAITSDESDEVDFLLGAHICTNLYTFQILDSLEEAVDAILKTKSAASSSTLQQNLKAKNSKKLIHCTICTKSFAKLEALKTYMRVHTDEKPYFCYQLAKSFSDSSHLHSHLRVHTGEKSHTCPQCTKSFSHLSNLRRHLKSSHRR